MRNRFLVYWLVLLVSAPHGWSWGNYGHQQINAAAVKLLSASEFQQWMKTNSAALQRLAITPDLDWKMLGPAPTDPVERKKKAQADRHEHPLHFFECDAFNAKCAAELPSGEYIQVFPQYQKLLSRNAARVAEIDPSKKIANPKRPTPKEVAEHGTAPWRVLQLYRLAVGALRERNFEQALFGLGVMGHYVGDMSQPFHATLNFDGAASKRPAAGIHHTFEEAILENAAKGVQAAKDPATELWSSFAATEEQVLSAARAERSAGNLSGGSVVGALLQLVSSGYPLVQPLLAVYAEECARANNKAGDKLHCVAARGTARHHGVRVGVGIERRFARKTIGHPARHTVLGLAEMRMGASAALLAHLWEAAYREAGRPAMSSARKIGFDQLKVLDRYPLPQYLPPGAEGSPRRAAQPNF